MLRLNLGLGQQADIVLGSERGLLHAEFPNSPLP
ncbi:hypothetical protein F383_20342 [Gossypium arboreum]|uniref:Uncharacterized protein n=1 Tax=Gossypium arboreum TaxID=29729 RepID=A0A0B0NFL5_GOSAR|nr:hypothetical protein F383_20342 [Gossypium arboreum]